MKNKTKNIALFVLHSLNLKQINELIVIVKKVIAIELV